MALRPIPTIDLGRTKPHIVGEIGELVLAPVDRLVIDGDYQRTFTPRNEDRCRHLIANWNWALYTPIIVASLEGGRWAVIDGQHRAASAKACRIKDLPAWHIAADAVAQAKAFLAVNASPTRVDSLQLWHSRRAAGEPDAIMLWDICGRAGVEIARYPLAANIRPANVTLCPGVVHDLRATAGKDLIVRTLKIMVAVGQAQKSSLLTRNTLRAVLRLVGSAWSELPDDAITAGLTAINFAKAAAVATVDAKERGISSTDALCEAISEKLMAALEGMDEAAQ